MNAQMVLEEKLSMKNMQDMIAQVIERVVVNAGHDVDDLFYASFYIMLEKNEFGAGSFVVIKHIDLKKNRKGRC